MAITAVVGAGVAGAAGSAIAGGEEAGAANNATAAQLRMYNQTRSDLMPYMNTGNSALSQLSGLMGLNGGNSASELATLQNTPGYQFAVQQGQQGLDRSAAARGLLLSGGQLKDTMSYNQNMADQLYGQTYNQLMGISNMGENAAAQTGNAATATGQGVANTTLAAGQASAGGIAGAANNIGSALYQYSMMNPGSTSYNAPYYSVGNGIDSGVDMLSDRRAKTDIRRVGRMDSGLNVYSYRLKGSQLPQIGVMADEVRKVDPAAVRRDARSGLDRVDYGRVSRLPPVRRAA